MASLIVVAGKSRGFVFKLAGESVVVGRDESCPIQIIDEKVSRRHLTVRCDEDGGYSVLDSESANGVYMGGQRIRASKLKHGDVIQIGESKLLFAERDFEDRDSALDYFRRLGEHERDTLVSRPEPKG